MKVENFQEHFRLLIINANYYKILKREKSNSKKFLRSLYKVMM